MWLVALLSILMQTLFWLVRQCLDAMKATLLLVPATKPRDLTLFLHCPRSNSPLELSKKTTTTTTTSATETCAWCTRSILSIKCAYKYIALTLQFYMPTFRIPRRISMYILTFFLTLVSNKFKIVQKIEKKRSERCILWYYRSSNIFFQCTLQFIYV